MLLELQEILEDLKKGKHIDLYITIGLAIVIAVLGALNVTDPSVVSALTLAVLAKLTYQIIKNRRISAIQGIRAFYPDRSYLPPLHTTLGKARHELLIVGVYLGRIVQDQLTLLEEKARAGCKVKLLIMSTTLADGSRNPRVDETGAMTGFLELFSTLNANRERFHDWWQSLESNARNNVELRCYEGPPTLTAIFVDKDSPNGLIHIEPIVPRTRPEERPSFRTTPHVGGDLYRRLRDKYEALWAQSRSLTQ